MGMLTRANNSGFGAEPAWVTQSFQAAGGSLLKLAPATGPVAAPFVAAAGVVLEIAGLIAKAFGPNPLNRPATGIVNAYTPYFVQNRDAALAGQIDKATALATFDAMWAQMVSDLKAIPDIHVVDRSIADRAPGGKFDLFASCRVPIEQLPDDSVTSVLSAGIAGLPSWALPVGIGVAVLLATRRGEA